MNIFKKNKLNSKFIHYHDNNYVADSNWIKSAMLIMKVMMDYKYNFTIIFIDNTYQYFSIQTNIALYVNKNIKKLLIKLIVKIYIYNHQIKHLQFQH